MGGEIDGGILHDELADAVERLAGGLLVLEDDAQLVGLEGSVAIGDVAVEHIEEAVVLGNDDAVAFGVALSLDEPDAIGHLLGVGEVLVGLTVLSAHDVLALQLHGISIFGRDVNLGVREVADAIGVVGMLVSDENLRHLLGLVACLSEGFHVVGHLLAHIERCAELLGRDRELRLETCVDKDDLLSRVDEEVLQRVAIDDLFVKSIFTLLTAKGKGLSHKPAVEHTDSFDYHG